MAGPGSAMVLSLKCLSFELCIGREEEKESVIFTSKV